MQKIIEVPCPICGSSKSKLLFPTQDYKQSISEDIFWVSRCRDCGGGFLSIRPSKNELPRYYDEHFYWSYENDDSVKQSTEQLLEQRAPQLDSKAAWLSHLSPGRLLDIGTMKGDFLYHMKGLGWQVEGVEFSNTPPNLFNMPIRYGDFLEMDLKPASYDCITMWAVLEHVYEPAEYVEKVASLLKPRGRFIFLVTNFNSIQGRCYEMDDYPRHLTLFTKRSARKILDQAGLKIVRHRTDQKIFGGHLQGGLVYIVKRVFGYSRPEVMAEWKNDISLDPFYRQWRGQKSILMRQLSRVDRLLLSPLEKLMDILGMGFILTIEAEKPLHASGEPDQ